MRRALFEDDSDEGSTDHEATPKRKAPQGQLRKQRSGHNDLDFDETNINGSPGRAPMRPFNINDDAAEKRRRRKSTKHVASGIENEEVGTSAEGEATGHRRRRLLNAPITIQPLDLPQDVMSERFETYMTLVTDNKINTNNSWTVALIDYFHDMSLLKNVSDGSINFTRASTTLDGCIKIYSSRVDSVGTATSQLLSNLTAGADDEQGDSEPEIDENGQVIVKEKRRRKATSKESTLAKNVETLRSKKLDLEFNVDPLFRKTCADFDEGGAHGLLMNHLSLGVGAEGGLRVVFDASDVVGAAGDDEEEQVLEPQVDVALDDLRRDFLPDLSVLDEKAISHSLASFSFGNKDFTFDDNTFYVDNTHATWIGSSTDDANRSGTAMDIDGGGQTEDFFTGDQAIEDNYEGGGFDYDEDGGGGGGDEEDRGETDTMEGGMRPPMGPAANKKFVPFDPRRPPNQRDMILAMSNPAAMGSEMTDYFDQAFLKNWAGPEHWKVRKAIRRNDDSGGATRVKRGRKEPFRIDFEAEAERSFKEISKEIFKEATPTALNLSAKAKKANPLARSENDNCLPDDFHFSGRQLVTLFLKPEFALRIRSQQMEEDGEPIDEEYWAKAAAQQAAGRADQDGDDDGAGPAPFNTQFFQDDDFDDDGLGGFDDGFEGPVGGAMADNPNLDDEQDLMVATSSNSRRVRPEFVKYTKRAKRVDVRKLKENIWRGLDIVVSHKEEHENVEADEEEPTATDPTEARVFGDVVEGLKDTYQEDKLSEISTSFCFICLLHLANEQGLKIQSVDDEEEGPSQVVANLWDLKVYRDPEATRAA